MYIMSGILCLFRTVRHRGGALQFSITIIVVVVDDDDDDDKPQNVNTLKKKKTNKLFLPFSFITHVHYDRNIARYTAVQHNLWLAFNIDL